jgi:hypothetical protein
MVFPHGFQDRQPLFPSCDKRVICDRDLIPSKSLQLLFHLGPINIWFRCNDARNRKRALNWSIEQLIETIKSTQTSGEDVLVSGFGKF